LRAGTTPWLDLPRNSELAELGRREKMSTRSIVAAMVLAVCTQATSVSGRICWTPPIFASPALEPGAVYEVSLRVPWVSVGEYLSLYAKWFLRVDVAPRSGRKLLTVLSREVGDDRNLVFLYWYESPYKEQYYCNYAREFFTYHLNADTRTELRSMYDEAARLLGEPPMDEAQVLAGLNQCQGNRVPVAVLETMRKVDEQLRTLVVSEEDSWNIGVNPCRVQKIRAAEKSGSTVTASDLETCEKSLLEMTVERLRE
jgi:hypothetical protein